MKQEGSGGQIPSENGVYIQSIDGKFYTYDEWNLPNEQANGVAVIDNRHPDNGFVIAKTEDENKKYGKENLAIQGMELLNNEDEAITDFKGYYNTNQIVTYDAEGEAAKYCKDYVFPNGKMDI